MAKRKVRKPRVHRPDHPNRPAWEFDRRSSLEAMLVPLSAWQRIKLLLSSRGSALNLIVVFVGMLSLVVTMYSYLEMRRAISDNPGYQLVQSAAKIEVLQRRIFSLSEAMRDDSSRAELRELLGVMNREVDTVRTIGETLRGHGRAEAPTLLDYFIAPASATETKPADAKFSIDDARPFGMLIILGALGLTFLGSIGTILFGRDPSRIAFAQDTVKTLMGFFIGVATTFFGASK